jgi:hypothetical protein
VAFDLSTRIEMRRKPRKRISTNKPLIDRNPASEHAVQQNIYAGVSAEEFLEDPSCAAKTDNSPCGRFHKSQG